MAKFLDTIGLTHLIGELDARYAAQFAATGHKHAASDITSGTFAIGRIPTGTTSATVALGNHTHSQYLTSVPDLASSKITTLGGYAEGSSTSTLTSSMTLNQALASLQNQIQAKTSNTGTVTSVTIVAGEGITVSSSAAITTSGSRTITLKEATNSALGGIQLKAAKRTTNLSSSITTGGTTSSRYYGVELDTNGLAFVNVPWTDTNTTYSAGDNISISGGKISSPDVSVSSSGSGYVSNISANGHGISVTKTALPTISVSDSGSGTFVTDVTASGHTITLTRGNGSTYTLPVATQSAIGGVKVNRKRTVNCTFNSAASSLSTAVTVNSPSTTSGRFYPVEADSDGDLFVNVPWTDTNTDTKNTAGSSNSSSKLFLVGATSQATSATTYSHDTVYVDANGRLNSRQSESGTAVSTVVTAADAMSTADIDAIFESLL